MSQISSNGLQALVGKKPRADVGPICDAVVSAACAHWHMDLRRVIGRDRTQHISFVRQVAMYLARELTRAPYKLIGQQFHRDHSTVVHACKITAQRIQEQQSFARSVEELRRECSYD